MKFIQQTHDEIQNAFKTIDLNGDGEISQIEFIKALRKNPDLASRLELPSQIHQEDGSRSLFQHAFQEIDVDASKTISINEFTAFYLPANNAPPSAPPFDSGPPPGYTNVSPFNYPTYLGDATVQAARPTASVFMIEGTQSLLPTTHTKEIKSSSPDLLQQTIFTQAPRRQMARNAPSPVAPAQTTGSMPPAGNQRPPRSPGQALSPHVAMPAPMQAFTSAQSPVHNTTRVLSQNMDQAAPMYTPWLPHASQTTYPNMSPPSNMQTAHQQPAFQPISYQLQSYQTQAYQSSYQMPVQQPMQGTIYASPSYAASPSKAPVLTEHHNITLIPQHQPAPHAMYQQRTEQATKQYSPLSSSSWREVVVSPTIEREIDQPASPAPKLLHRAQPHQEEEPVAIQEKERQKTMRSAPRLSLSPPQPLEEEAPIIFKKSERQAQRSGAPRAQRSAAPPPPPETPISLSPVPAPPSSQWTPMALLSQHPVGHIVGVGLQLENTDDGQGNNVEVCYIVPGFAAAESNQFDVGDLVLSIDGIKVQGRNLSDIKNLTIGKAGTQVVFIMRSLYEGRDYKVVMTRKIPDHVDGHNEDCARAVLVE